MSERWQRYGAAAHPVPMPKPHGALATFIAGDRDFRGIGPALATRLADRFGRYLRNALADRDPAIIEMLGYDLAETTFAAFQVKSHEADLIDWLERKSVATAVGVPTAIRIARCWGGDGVQELMKNPYLLTAFLPWRTVEKVARALDITPDDPRRAAAAVESVLYARLDRNDTLTPRCDVEAGVVKLLNSAAKPAGGPAIRPIDAAVESGGACWLGDGLQPFGAAVMEETIARQIAAAVQAEPYHDLVTSKPSTNNLADRIEAFGRSQPHALTERQQAAIRAALTNRVMILAGYAGSGKTTALRGICDIADSLGRELHLMALSGRAAQRMSIATGRPARTIAGFLQIGAGGTGEAVAPGAMVIINEASMLDLPTLWRIMKALGEANLLLVGDPAQLPPIGFGLTFHVLCNSDHVPRIVLDKVMRQSSSTGIPTVAEAIRNGELSLVAPFSGMGAGVSFIKSAPDEAIDVISDVGRSLNASGAALGETQIIAPVRSGPAGIDAINRHFHAARQRLGNNEFFPCRDDLAGGDPIIWTKNDWDRELMNGSMGRLHSVIDGIGHATLDGKAFDLSPSDANFLDLAYAISVHKAQGSQWRRVIVPVFRSRLLDRTLLYTAITRASEQVIIIGDAGALHRAIQEAPVSLKRSVGLPARLQQAFRMI